MHLSDGTLRRSVDEPFALDAVRRRHLEACSQCRQRVDAIRTDSERVTALIATAASPVIDTDAALRRLHSRLRVPGRQPAGGAGWLRDRRRRGRVTRWSAAVVGAASVGVVLVGAGAAQGFITIFQPRQVAPVAVTEADISSLQGLASYGDVSGVPSLTLTQVTRGQAQALTGVTPPSPPTLPSGIPSIPTYDVINGGTVTFTFDRSKAQAAAERDGATLPPMPANIEASTLQLIIPSALVESYGIDIGQLVSGGTSSLDGQGLVIVAALLPRATSTGASAAQVEDYLLAQPGVPADLAAELHAIGNPSSTLPIPIPVSLASAQAVSVDGAAGLLIGDQTGVGSLVLWQHGRVVYAVLGSVSSGEVLDVAESIG
jgi:anti-sigma factor RsiW